MTTKHDNQRTLAKNNYHATNNGQQGPIKSTYCCPSELSRKYTENNKFSRQE